MGLDVVDLGAIDRTQVALAGGKGANLGELLRIEGTRVPAGFCVTTGAFRRVVADAPGIDGALDRLSRLGPDDLEEIRAVSGEARRTIEALAIPDDLEATIIRSLATLGENAAYAVRSSATAEDLPTASFAGQHDTYLDVAGPTAILRHVSRCWASLFSERAVAYRLRNGVNHRNAHMAVVVQRMVIPQAAGVLFTADPVTGDRKVATVEAGLGLGEALVSGRVNADVFTVRGGEVLAKSVASGEQPALTDAQVVQLVQLGRRIEAHFGHPQDIEWCLDGDGFWIVQSRPITTLFPIPGAVDQANRVYISVGHQQMMTDPMKPLGLSLWQLTTPRPMAEAGGRLFVDVTQGLASPDVRAGLLDVLGRSDPLIGDALQTIVDRGDFVRPLPDEAPATMPPGAGAPASIETDPAVVTELIRGSEASLAAVKRDILTTSGPALIEFILDDIQELRRILFDPTSRQVIMAGMEASWWLRDQLETWLEDGNAADTLTQSVPHNVTAEMGLALLDVADVIRPHPEVVAFLESVEDERFLDVLPSVPGGREARDAIQGWLDEYGMRCVGEIDVTRPRWSERPVTLVPMILGNVESFEPGEAKRRFEHGRQEARAKEREVLERLRALPDGKRKADEAKRTIDRLRAFAGYREYPKYGMVSRYFVYKQALLGEADRLVQAHVLAEREDIFYLRLEELHDVVRNEQGGPRARPRAQGRVRVVPGPHAAAGDHVRRRGDHRDVPARGRAGRRARRPAGLRRGRRGAGPRRPRRGGGRSRSRRRPGHRLHRPELHAPLRRDQGPGDRGGRSDDPRRGDRARVRPAGGGGGGACDPADSGRAADPRPWHGRVRRAPALIVSCRRAVARRGAAP